MVRVLQVLGRSAGGIARHVAHITGELDGAGFAVDVAGPPGLPGEMPKELIDLVIPDGVWGHGSARRTLHEIVTRGGYDVVHSHGLRAGIDAGRAVPEGVRSIVTVHNLVQPEVAGALKARVYRYAEPMAVRSNDVALGVSREIVERLRAAAPDAAGRVHLLHLGIGDPPHVRKPAAEVKADLGLTEDRRMLVSVARLAPQKALPVMFEAIARLQMPARLAILGQGPLEAELRARVSQMGLEDSISFLGYRDDAADIVAAADAFCLSSAWEGVPLAAQEAILLGTPVVSTDVGGMAELVEDGISGRLVPKGDARALASAIDAVLADLETAAGMAARARAALLENFSTERMLERLAALYRGETDA